MCYEGHRFFDMRRFNLPIYKPMIDKTLDINDHHRIQPIPFVRNARQPGNCQTTEQWLLTCLKNC